MKTTVKWILGLVIGFLVIGSILMIGYLMFNRWGTFGWVMGPREIRSWDGQRFKPMQLHWRVPERRFLGVLPLRFIGGSFLFIGLLSIIILGVFVLFRAIQNPQQSSAPSAPFSSSTATPAGERVCGNCNNPVQDEWSHCPFCGETLD